MIEYGGDNAREVKDDALLSESYGLVPGGYCFKVARIEPENNIEIVLGAFDRAPEHKLVLVGNWQKSKYGIRIKEEYSARPNIMLLDAIYDQEKLNLLRSNCGLYLHGHSMGGTNPSLVEAMSLGLPVAAYDVVYNRETTEGKALYFTDSASLAAMIVDMDKETLMETGVNLREVAGRRYKWSIITEKYERLFVKG